MAEIESGTVQAGTATVHWRRQGSGPAVVLLHAFPLTGETWDKVAQRLRGRFTCIALDLIGLGGSSGTHDGDYASPGQARAFKETLTQLGVASYALVGNDTGGWIARELALIDPRVRRMVLANTEIPGHRPPWIPLYQTLAHWPGAGAGFAALLRLRAYRRSPLALGGCFSDLNLLDGDFHERFIAPLIASRARIDGAMRFLRCMKFARLDAFAREHAKLSMPVLFVWGREDPTFPVERARVMAGQFPNVAGFHEIANAKLLLHEEQPGAFAEHVGRFCAAA